MRVLVLGSGGMLGQDIVSTAPSGITVLGLSKAELDITSNALELTTSSLHPDLIINAAAYTAVDRAETERDLAFRINAEAVGELGRIAVGLGVTVIHYSSDYVFDGTASRPYNEECRPKPVNTYGASKLAGENALRDSGASFLILRSQWLFGVHGRSFPRTMYERAKAGLATRVVTDQIGRPTYTRDLARATWRLAQRNATGLFHFANDGQATWFDVAVRVFGRFDRTSLVTPCTSAEYPTAARRPSYSVLDTRNIQRLLGTPIEPFGTALDDFLDRITP